jgi:hypothetical protein
MVWNVLPSPMPSATAAQTAAGRGSYIWKSTNEAVVTRQPLPQHAPECSILQAGVLLLGCGLESVHTCLCMEFLVAPASTAPYMPSCRTPDKHSNTNLQQRQTSKQAQIAWAHAAQHLSRCVNYACKVRHITTCSTQDMTALSEP